MIFTREDLAHAISILLLGDLHCGSMFGLYPPDFPLSTGGKASLNVAQEFLQECWLDFLARLPKRLDYVVFTGDVTEGKQYKDDGLGVIEPDPECQVNAAVALCRPITERAEEVYVLRGSRYHTGYGGRCERSFGRQLEAQESIPGNHTHPWLLLDVGNGVTFDIAHHQSVTIVNRSMPLERELRFAQIIEGNFRPDADFVVRAHNHSWLWMNIDGRIAASIPAWKFSDDFVRMSKTPNRYVSRLFGAVLVYAFPWLKTPEVRNREDFITKEFLSYPTPELKAVHGGVEWQDRSPDKPPNRNSPLTNLVRKLRR